MKYILAVLVLMMTGCTCKPHRTPDELRDARYREQVSNPYR